MAIKADGRQGLRIFAYAVIGGVLGSIRFAKNFRHYFTVSEAVSTNDFNGVRRAAA